MGKIIRLACCTAAVLAAGAWFSGPAFSQSYSKEQMQAMYMEFLRQEGYQAEIDQDGDVRFRHEGGVYYIIVNENDPVYFSILYPNFWSIESDDEWITAAAACMTASRSIKVAKVVINSRNTNTSIEVDVFLPNAKEFSAVFSRMMSSVAAAKNKFLEEVRR